MAIHTYIPLLSILYPDFMGHAKWREFVVCHHKTFQTSWVIIASLYSVILYLFLAHYVCSLLAVCEEQQRGRQRLVQVGVKQRGNKVCVCLPVCLSVCLSVCLCVCLSVYLLVLVVLWLQLKCL